jgi:hydroxymethylbilane synthase
MAQSLWVQDRLESLGVEVEQVLIRTDGDDSQRWLTEIGGQGLFTRRLQTALLDNTIDLAVHSLKDLPTKPEAGLRIAAIPVRENRADVLISAQGLAFRDLPQGAIVGTGSLRRAAQLKRRRPDLEIRDIRGNIDSRLRQLDEGKFDAIVLAAAGLNRLGLGDRITELFDPAVFFPAVGQGALALEVRAVDCATAKWVEQLDDRDSHCTAMAERAMLSSLKAGCLAAVGANVILLSGMLDLSGMVLSPEGRRIIIANDSAVIGEFEKLGCSVARALLDRGAKELLEVNR